MMNLDELGQQLGVSTDILRYVTSLIFRVASALELESKWCPWRRPGVPGRSCQAVGYRWRTGHQGTAGTGTQAPWSSTKLKQISRESTYINVLYLMERDGKKLRMYIHVIRLGVRSKWSTLDQRQSYWYLPANSSTFSY